MGNYSSFNRRAAPTTTTEASTSTSCIPETASLVSNCEPGGTSLQAILGPAEGMETTPSIAMSMSDGNQDAKGEEDDNQRQLDPNTKRKLANKRKLAESSDGSSDDESLETHKRGLVRQRPSLKKHQVPQPKLPKITTHNKRARRK